MNNSIRIAFSVIINILIVFALLLILAMASPSFDRAILALVMSLAFLSTITFVINCYLDKRFKNQYIRNSYFFLVGYIIVFFQNNIDLLCGYITENDSVFGSSDNVNTSAIISAIGFCCYSIGNILSQRAIKMSNFKLQNIRIGRSFMLFQKIGLAVFSLIYFVSIFSTVTSGQYNYSMDTMAQNAGSLLNYSYVMVLVFTFTFLTTTIFKYKNCRQKITLIKYFVSNGILFNGSLIIFLALQFMIGDRGPLINVLLAYLLSYVIISRKKIRLLPILVSIILAGVVLTAISHVRKQTNLVTVSDILEQASRSDDISILPSTKELAGSYRTLTHTVLNIPKERDYFYGAIQLRELVYSIPMLHRIMPFVFSEREYENGSTNYCTYLVQGLSSTYGNGSSILADIYLDFGLLGIIIILSLLGMFVYKLDIEIYYGNNIYWLLAALVFFSFSIYMSRAPLSTPLYYILPGFLIIYLRNCFEK